MIDLGKNRASLPARSAARLDPMTALRTN